MSIVLIVDDDPHLRTGFEKLLKSEGYEVRSADSAESGLEIIGGNKLDLVVMDVRLPGMSGLECLSKIRDLDPKLPVIVMTAFGTTETAIEATKKGAYDYILKPFEIPDALDLIEKAIESGVFARKLSKSVAESDDLTTEGLIGSGKAMQEVYKSIGRVAGTDATVLIRGESGTGKELAATAVYQHSPRAGKPFVIINCVAIPETLLESELFGHEKGAFTGAGARRVGKIERANHGTVFLDEIGDIPLSVQAKLLRLLQEKSIERLGGRAPIPVDVRVIAATNRDLESAINEGKFREDLYFRLKVVTITMPPLRDRGEDVFVLAEYFLRRLSREMSLDNPGLTEKAREIISAYPWPGNVRELANVMRRALIFCRNCPIGEMEIARTLFGNEYGVGHGETDIDETLKRWIRHNVASLKDGALFETLMEKFEALLIGEALAITGGNRSRASRLLAMSRPTLLSKIDKYKLKLTTRVTID